jgi:AcrR family transcriptional regulator
VKLTTPIETGDKHLAETRQQLLAAAAAVFAEVGFRDATVREICRRAEANIAAVNYHFGDKETLYAEVLRYAYQIAMEKHPLRLEVGPDGGPEKRLRAFVHSLLSRIFDEGAGAWHGQLMAREMIEPTAALDVLVEERIRPMSNELWKVIAEILGCPVHDERVRLCGFSVVSQCLFYKHCHPVVCRLFPKLKKLDAAGIEQLADHITQFSLAAMKNLPPHKI